MDRRPAVSYRLAVREKDCVMSVYSRSVEDLPPNLRGSYVPSQAAYDFFIEPQHLPKWVRDAMPLLDAAGDGHKVEGVGVRLHEGLYWFPPDG